MRKEASNTFTEGLIQDLNPINTPNTVLTDNLNGTIITYDGNEYSLQNDRGNYPLQYCKLKPNYIPVGVKEYADTLYIVSYNPLDKKTEIGSYPSPLEISSSNDNNDNVNLPSLIKQSIKTPNYTDLIQNTKLHVFSDEELKMYPGDEYQINLQDESKYIYEELEYYIVDENRNKYNITEHIKENNHSFVPVGWTVPGWMAIQYRIAVFEDFQMNIRSFAIPALSFNSDGKLSLNFQLKISDKLLLNRIEDHSDEVGLKITITKNNNKTLYSGEEVFSNLDGGIVEWYETSKILWGQSEFNLSELNQGDKLTISATPFIQIKVDGSTYKVIYDNFTENLEIPLTNIGSFSDFTLAGNNWKFWVEEDDPDNLYLEFDVSGPLITSNIVNLYYRIHEIKDKSSNNGSSTNYIKLESYNGVGQNMIQIPFDPEESGLFKSEGMYVIEFVFVEDDPSNVELKEYNSKIIKKLVIASQIFSSFVGKYNNFEDITFDEWVSKYPETIKNADKWDIVISGDFNTRRKDYSKGDVTDAGISGVDVPEHLFDFWKSKSYKNKYDHTAFITEDEWDDTVGEQTKFLRGYETKAKVDITTEFEVLNGSLWDNMERNISIKVESHGEKIDEIPYSIGWNKFQAEVYPIVAKSCLVSYDRMSQLVKGSESRNNIYNKSGNNIRFGIVMGKTRHQGSNHYIEAGFKGFPLNIDDYTGDTVPKNVDLITELGDKSKIPNSLTGKISGFLANNNLPFCIVFVVARGVSDSSDCQVYSSKNKLVESGNNYVNMQPFVVFKNKQNNPIFFTIEGFESFNDKRVVAGAGDSGHGFPFSEFDLELFVNKIKSRIGDLVRYKIYEITDGYFIKCSANTESDLTLNIETNVDIPGVYNWNFKGYNLLNYLDRNQLNDSLKDKGVGNLLQGSVSELDAIEVTGLKYNTNVNDKTDINNKLKELSERINIVNDYAEKQYTAWSKDKLFETENTEISGLSIISTDSTNSSDVETFKQSDLYKLIERSNTFDELTLNATGEKFFFRNSKDEDNSDYCMGYLHSSITFP